MSTILNDIEAGETQNVNWVMTEHQLADCFTKSITPLQLLNLFETSLAFLFDNSNSARVLVVFLSDIIKQTRNIFQMKICQQMMIAPFIC